jgi:dynein heavy chain, axonemal
MTEQC